MSYDLAYIPLNELQTIFLDKDTGLPLSGGKITFYKDDARTELKNIFHLHGGYGFYEYVSLPNPSTLSAIGTFVDENGNDVVPYAYPYNLAGERELYYITVESSDGRPQFTRDAVPWNPSSTTPIIETTDNINYVKNGQFNELNPDILTNSTYALSTSSTLASDGSYKFYLNGSSLNEYGSIHISRDIVSTADTAAVWKFSDSPLPGTVPEGFASRYFDFSSPGASSTETKKDIIFVIGDYGMFADSDITVAITGLSDLSGNSSIIKVYALQHNGIIPDVITFSTTPVEQSLSNALTKYFFNLHVPALVSGAKYQGYFAIGVRFPLNLPSHISITNVQVNPGFVTLPYAYDGEAVTAALTIADKIASIPEPGTSDPSARPLGLGAMVGMVPTLKRELTSTGTPYIYWQEALPTGMIVSWSGPENTIPKRFKILDGRPIGSYKFNRLYAQYSSNYSAQPIYGWGSTVTSSDVSVSDTIHVMNSTVGVCPGPVNTVTGTQITITQAGDSTHKLAYNIVVTAATGAGIGTNGVLTVYATPNIAWNIRFVVDNVVNNSVITNDMLYDDSTTLVYIRSDWTKTQIATAILNVFKPSLSFLLPDYRAMFPRGVNGTRADAYADPNPNGRGNRGDGTTGNNVGTVAQDTYKSHGHGFTALQLDSLGTSYAAGGLPPFRAVGSSTNNIGYPETTPKNIYCYWIIKAA